MNGFENTIYALEKRNAGCIRARITARINSGAGMPQRIGRPLNWFMAFLLSACMVGCGGTDPILGGGGAGAPLSTPTGAVIPGACTIAGPKVTTSDPLSGDQLVTTSTTGVAGNGKSITATFDTVMDPATINATTFKLAIVGGTALVPASVSYNALAATFTTAVPLLANTSYLAIITVGAKSGTGNHSPVAMHGTLRQKRPPQQPPRQ